MSKIKQHKHIEVQPLIVAESRKPYGLRTYISLYSSAGIGCYGFKEENFHCIASVELLERRLKIQTHNKKCIYTSGYICGDMTELETKDKVFAELDLWKKVYNANLDVLIATPPCQGMSVANHKKKNELGRNSLIVESIELTKKIKPKIFLFENVRAFLTSICTDNDGKDKPIKQAIDYSLSGEYNIHFQVLNFKDYGCPSSRTRTLVIGVRKDLKEITPLDLFPNWQPERTLRQIIGHLPSLKKMGEITKEDIYHNFRKYSPQMESWIADIKEGQSAFDNEDHTKIPHSVKDGIVVYNAKKNGDKYTRQYWDKVAPCIHTRNDIMASQSTVHPSDNRVFSIREVMLMMSVPNSFNWSDVSFDNLNLMTIKEKHSFLKREEINIRQSLGEAVPTVIFRQIAHKIRIALSQREYTEQEITTLIQKKKLVENDNLLKFIKEDKTKNFATLSKIAELANAQRYDNSAYYTRQDICFSIIKNLPEAKNYTNLNILEPSIGVGNFLPTLINKYKSVPTVNIDVVDIDKNSIELLKELIRKIDVPENITINYINVDFLLHSFNRRYDIVVGNPPYMKITKEKALLAKYKANIQNNETNNIFAFFIEKALTLGNVVSLIVPKSLINAPEFNKTRSLMSEHQIERIIDFGEKGFKGVKIETICFIMSTKKKPSSTIIESYITDNIQKHEQSYITDKSFPYWLIYRNEKFDEVAKKLEFNIFKSYRDRVITKAFTKEKGKIRVLKSRNIGNNEIIDIPDYDCYMDDVSNFDVSKFLNQKNCYLLPNLTYNPRSCELPKGCITDGSVAIITLIDENTIITKNDLAFYATDEFTYFYAIARNMGTRSLNIDNNSVFFFGKLKEEII
ncbi:MAG: DNA cytosine methyltransferase [Tannerella sp.]|jgi:DNA (cytosine-5)-methyltransferase 1|nr:DNA cytosine methyltransferase [Tannerella sp.]